MKIILLTLLMGIVGFDLIQARSLSETENKGLEIIHGQNVTNDAYKFMLTIYYFPDQGDTEFICGGTIISKQHLLTAASCFIKSDKAEHYRGAHSMINKRDDRNSYKVKVFIKHEDYHLGKITPSNIAVAKVIDEFNFNNPVVQKVQIRSNPPHIQPVQVLGWGQTEKFGESAVLQEVTLWLMSECYNDISYLCASDNNEKSIGNADEGGPMVEKLTDNTFVQHGIIIGMSGNPNNVISVFTRIAEFYDWVQKKIQK